MAEEIDFIYRNWETMTRVAMAKAIGCPISIFNRKMKELEY
jgi:hypothetical protein